MIVNFWFIRHLYISCVASTGSLFVEPCIVLAATSTHSLGCPDGPQSSNRSSSSLEQVSVLSLQQYICIRYAYNTPPHATPTGPNVRPKTCKTLPRFSGSRHKLLCCFPTNSQCPNIPWQNKHRGNFCGTPRRSNRKDSTGATASGSSCEGWKCHVKRRGVGWGPIVQVPIPQTSQPMAGKRFTLGQSTAACAILTFRCKLVCSLQKKQDQSQCVFSDPAPTTQCAHSKAGAGYFGRFGTPWTVYKTKSDHSSDLVFSHFTLGDFALSGTDGSVPAPRLGSCLETLVEGYRINTWRVKGFESVHTLPFNAQHFQGSCSLSVCPHRSPQM